jgi:hypothetical protein
VFPLEAFYISTYGLTAGKKSDPYRKNLSQCISQLKSLIDQISIQQEDIVGLEGTDTLHLHFPLYSRIDVTTQSRHISEIVPIKKISRNKSVDIYSPMTF